MFQIEGIVLGFFFFNYYLSNIWEKNKYILDDSETKLERPL